LIAIAHYNQHSQAIRDGTLFLVVPLDVYQTFFQLEFTQTAVQRYQILLVVYNHVSEAISIGVSRQDIVLGLQPSYKRPYTDYGIA